jgi:hypothetical protein
MRLAGVVLLGALVAGCPEDPTPSPDVPTPDHAPLAPVPTPPVATLITLEGKVDLERDGGVSKAGAGPLFEGDIVTTGVASRAVLRDGRGRDLELGEETRFQVGAKLETLELFAGAITFGAGDGGAWQGVTLKTGAGTATLGDGVLGQVRVVDGGVAGQLSFGEIEFELPDAGTTTVKQGDFSLSFGAVELDLPPERPASSAVTARVEAGRPVVRRPGDKAFKPLSPGEALVAGTAVQVPKNATLKLEAGHAAVVLSGGASGVAEGVRDEGGVPVIALSKFVGALTLQLDGKGSGGVQVGEVTVGGGQEATVGVTPAGKKTRLEVKAGEVVVTANGKPTTVRAGDAVLVDAGGAAVSEVKPGLVVNGGARVKVHASGLANVAVVLPEEKNRVQVARDEAFTTTFISGTVGRQVLVPGAAKGQLYFRVTDAAGQPVKQGRVDFLDDVASARDTTTRSDVVAETGQKATVYYQSKVPALTFAFNPFEGAKGWLFQLYRAGSTTAVVERRVAEQRLVLEPGVLSEGDFLWSATPLDANEVKLAGARMNKLEVLYDNARTTLLIERPLPGERMGPDVKAVGVAPSRAQLYVNGKLVKTDDRGRFSVPVGKAEAVLFRVVTGETESYWLRRLRR